MKKVVVFGGSGFLGSYVADELTYRKYEVIIADIKESKFKSPNQNHVYCDILKPDTIESAIQGADIVYNFAGLADIDESINLPAETMQQNVIGNINILEACRTRNVERYLYASSAYAFSTKGPILSRNEVDPLFTAAPSVLIEDGLWRMWYTSNTEWRLIDDVPTPKYHIKYAESQDGIAWDRQGVVAIDFKNEHEYAISRPWVVRENDRYQMWYSFRGDFYRIGYAESDDGISWRRLDENAEINVSNDGFDSEMIEYGAIVENLGRKYMLYNGNNYGQDGIGLAVSV